MSSSSLATLGALRLKAQYRSDMINNPAISTPEWNGYISDSRKELFDILVGAYGTNYKVGTPYLITMTANQFYDLPDDFYKLLGVDLQYSSSPTGWITLKRFEFIDRNKYAYLQSGINSYAQTARIWYIPEPPSLEFLPSCVTTYNSATISMEDVTGLSVGMSVDGPSISDDTTIVSINTTLNQVTLSSPALATKTAETISFWIDSATVDGISGWEEYVIIDAAIKAGIKQNFDTTQLEKQKEDMKKRIEAMAEGRDVGQASHSSDALSVNSSGYYQVGNASLKYTLLGDQLMLAAIPDDCDGNSFYGSGWGG